MCHCFFVCFFATGYPGFQTTTYTSRSYTGIAPGYTYQFPGECGRCTCCTGTSSLFNINISKKAACRFNRLFFFKKNCHSPLFLLKQLLFACFPRVFFSVYFTSLRNSCVLPVAPPLPFVQPSCLSSQYFFFHFLLNVSFCGFVVCTVVNGLTQHFFSLDLFCL